MTCFDQIGGHWLPHVAGPDETYFDRALYYSYRMDVDTAVRPSLVVVLLVYTVAGEHNWPRSLLVRVGETVHSRTLDHRLYTVRRCLPLAVRFAALRHPPELIRLELHQKPLSPF